MARTSDARQKALATAERLFRIQGYAATGLTQILDESGAPKGSFYFHFPGGKEQLAREVLASYGADVATGMRALAERSADADAFVRALCKGIGRELEVSGWVLGCAVQTLASELASVNPEIAGSARAVFESWIEIVSDVLVQRFGDRRQARRHALALIAALEGARTLARVMGSAEPFRAVAERMTSDSVRG
jgi:TetR/AcrR family transcriptional regulator, lmrAB and yxaGH operons repressor